MIARLALIAALAVALSGCVYDYAQRSDKIAYSAGDAVRHNLEQETTNPSKHSMKSTSGLGKNGVVVPGATTSSSTGTAAAN